MARRHSGGGVKEWRCIERDLSRPGDVVSLVAGIRAIGGAALHPSSAVSTEGLTERGWKKGSGLGAKGEGISAVAPSRKCLVLQG
jgi:hypothetical protein